MSRHRRKDCPLCGGHETVSLSRGAKVAVLAQCFKCHAPFKDLAIALGIPIEPKALRRPPIRGTAIDRTIQELADDLEVRRARLLPWADYLHYSAECRWAMNRARFLRRIAMDLGDCARSWAFLEEAAQHEQRARLLVLELDRYLDLRNATLQAIAGAEVTA